MACSATQHPPPTRCVRCLRLFTSHAAGAGHVGCVAGDASHAEPVTAGHLGSTAAGACDEAAVMLDTGSCSMLTCMHVCKIERQR